MAKLFVPTQAARVAYHDRGKWHLEKPWRMGGRYTQKEHEQLDNDKAVVAACGQAVPAQGDLAEGYVRETADIEDISAVDLCKACLGTLIAYD